jgi:outer membrane protein assembly factor BamB
MFRAGPHHQGVYAGVGDAGQGLIEWSFRTEGPIRGSPLVDSVLVYIGSGDGHFYAIDRESGEERWRFEAGSPIQSSPAADGNLVYFGDRANVFYALDRGNGRLKWRVETGNDYPWEWGHEGWDYFTSSPAVVGGLVIVGSGDGHVIAFEAESGVERWRVATEGRVRASPAVANGVVYVGSADGFLYAIALESGERRWKFETEGASFSSAEFGFDRKTIQSSPAVADGVVYFGSRDGKLYAVDATSGELRWRHDNTTPWVISSPALYEGSVFVGTSDGLFLHAVDMKSGEEIWRFATDERVFSSPSVSGSSLYVGVHSRRLLALDVATGSVAWELRLGGPVMSSPVLYDDRIYVGSDDGKLYSVRLVSGPPPRRAVYWDEERLPFNTLASHEDVRDYFEAWGYEVLDRVQLAELMAASVTGGPGSVVVFAMDDLPPSVAPVAADTVLARRYLEAGGKVVWLGLPPLFLDRDAEGRVTGISRERPGALLGVDYERYDIDQYAASPTPEGRRWGFDDWWVSASGVDVSQISAVLALDENGGASAWVKSYGGPPGSGLVSLWGTYRSIPAEHFEQIRRVAEYGIGMATVESTQRAP